jgi:hypothetical protein
MFRVWIFASIRHRISKLPALIGTFLNDFSSSQYHRSLPPFTSRTCGIKELHMITVFKWLFAAIGTALAWLITGYTVEYFRPYKRK